MVKQVQLTGFDGPAIYDFTYEQSTIARGCPHTDTTLPATAQVTLLTSVTLPDGSSYQMPVSDYVTNASGFGLGAGPRGCWKASCCRPGARLEINYGDYTSPTMAGCTAGRPRAC